ncbi:TPA: dehydrogenase [Candidatus Marinimicrobia bacterium]|nr:dehydrogenase [Candidatus Neomarinimicrobiota bacterium]HBY18839.1 dehydrogenase [Candidatus Neomarinimicrobiota bacterium]
MIHVGIIGAGFMGSSHLENLRRVPGIKVLALADSNKASAQKLADMFNIPRVYSDWKELLHNPDIQAVHNCTPNYLHFEINKAAILAGKAIISEKPLTNSVAEAEELVCLAEEKNVLNAVNFSYRNYPMPQQIKELIDEKKVGDIYLVHGHYLQDWLLYPNDYNWRVEPEWGGESRAVADIGSHGFDLIQFLTGQNMTAVFADLQTIHKTRLKPQEEVETFKGKETGKSSDVKEIAVKTEDAGIILFKLEKGGMGVFTVSQVSAGHKNCFDLEINGSRMSVSWNQENPNQLWLGYRDKANEVLVKDPALLTKESAAYSHYPGGHPEGYPDAFKNLFLNFYSAYRNKKPADTEQNFSTFKDGLQENRIVDAILQSHREKTWINLES